MISNSERNKYIRIARELCYSKDVIDKIETARSAYAIERILKDARLRDD